MITSVPVPQIQEQIVEVIKAIPQEQMSKRIVEQIVDVPVPQIMEETVEAAKSIPQEGVQQRALEETVNVPTPQILVPFVAVVNALFWAPCSCSAAFNLRFLREGGGEREGGGWFACTGTSVDVPPLPPSLSLCGQCVGTGTGMSETAGGTLGHEQERTRGLHFLVCVPSQNCDFFFFASSIACTLSGVK